MHFSNFILASVAALLAISEGAFASSQLKQPTITSTDVIRPIDGIPSGRFLRSHDTTDVDGDPSNEERGALGAFAFLIKQPLHERKIKNMVAKLTKASVRRKRSQSQALWIAGTDDPRCLSGTLRIMSGRHEDGCRDLY
ncbi:hypothetical protein GQ600_9408 [Phytophthora cactorum]|nr:hypothetical protein GQ600_9408 [Phytophthora cactorum]